MTVRPPANSGDQSISIMNAISDERIARIKQTVRIQDLYALFGLPGDYGNLKFKVPCPFHGDANPSAKLYDGGEYFKCFACQAYGDAIWFVGRFLGLPFPGAVEFLENSYGLAGSTAPVEKKSYREYWKFRQQCEDAVAQYVAAVMRMLPIYLQQEFQDAVQGLEDAKLEHEAFRKVKEPTAAHIRMVKGWVIQAKYEVQRWENIAKSEAMKKIGA